MKTNVSIKFNSIEEYRAIEKKLEEMGYVNDTERSGNPYLSNYVVIYTGGSFCTHLFKGLGKKIVYNSLEEFLNDQHEKTIISTTTCIHGKLR